VSEADASLAFAEVDGLDEERRPVDELHGGERCHRVAGRHSGPDRVPVDPADRQDGDATAVALRIRRLGWQRNDSTNVVRASVSRLEPEAQDTSTLQPVVVDRVLVKIVRQRVNRRLVLLTTRHCDGCG